MDAKAYFNRLVSSLYYNALKLFDIIYIFKRNISITFFTEYFCKEYCKEFEKLWIEHTKAATNVQVPIKQSAVIHDDSQIDEPSLMPLCNVLIRLKSETAKLVVEKSSLSYTVESLSAFLKIIESSYSSEFRNACQEDKSILDVNVRGFEHISFDWILALCKSQNHYLLKLGF